MPIPPPIDPRVLAAEIESTVSEFNRLVNLADQLGLQVLAELSTQARQGGNRPLLAVQVIAPIG